MTLSTFTHNVLEMDPILFLSYVFWAGVGVKFTTECKPTSRKQQ